MTMKVLAALAAAAASGCCGDDAPPGAPATTRDGVPDGAPVRLVPDRWSETGQPACPLRPDPDWTYLRGLELDPLAGDGVTLPYDPLYHAFYGTQQVAQGLRVDWVWLYEGLTFERSRWIADSRGTVCLESWSGTVQVLAAGGQR